MKGPWGAKKEIDFEILTGNIESVEERWGYHGYGVGFIGCTCVQEQYRQQGIGRKITNRILKWFKENGIEYVELSVDFKNKIGHNVWKSLGFKTWQLKMKKRIQFFSSNSITSFSFVASYS